VSYPDHHGCAAVKGEPASYHVRMAAELLPPEAVARDHRSLRARLNVGNRKGPHATVKVSMQGKGTRTTSRCSKTGIRLAVSLAIPLLERGKGIVRRRGPTSSQDHLLPLDLVYDFIPRAKA
jgi:hypothetical protein